MTLRRIAILGAIVLAFVVAAPLVFVATLDVDDYRGLLAKEVERRTGRAMRADGGLALAVSLTPTFSAEAVSLANAAWASQAHMVNVDRLEARVALLPLLAGRVEIRRLLLVRPVIELETAPDGQVNWTFGHQDPQAADADVDAGAGVAGSGPRLGFDVRSVELRGLRVTHRDGSSGVVRVLGATSLTLAAAGERLSVLLEGQYQDRPLTVSGTLDRLPTLLANAPYALDLTLTVPGVEASVDGEVVRPAEAPEFTGRATLRVDDLAARADLAERGIPAGLAFAATADGVSASARAVRIGAIALGLGGSSGTGTMSLAPGPVRPTLEAALTFERLDLDQLRSGEVSAGPASSGPRVFSDAALDLSALRALDARVRLDAKSVRIAGTDVAGVQVTAVLSGGVLVVDPIEAGVGGSQARGRARLDAAGEDLGVAAAFDAAGVDLATLLGPDSTGYIEGRADLALDVTGRGTSIAGVMGSLDGTARALVGEGRVRARAAEMMIGGVTALMSTMTTDDSAWSTLRCAAADFSFASGLATANVLLVDTEHATVKGEGSADLGAERLAMKFTPSPKSVTLNVAVPVKVSGTFTDPQFRPDELETARRVGSVALLAFPPTAIASLGSLALYGASAAGAGLDDRVGTTHPCLQLASGAGADPAPAEEPSKAKKAAANVKKQLGRAAERIKGLFGQ